jgi:hypothetical protein
MMDENNTACPGCGASPMTSVKRDDGAHELRCRFCGGLLILPAANPQMADAMKRIEKLELAIRACTADQLDFAKAVSKVEKRVEKLEGGKVE